MFQIKHYQQLMLVLSQRNFSTLSVSSRYEKTSCHFWCFGCCTGRVRSSRFKRSARPRFIRVLQGCCVVSFGTHACTPRSDSRQLQGSDRLVMDLGHSFILWVHLLASSG